MEAKREKSCADLVRSEWLIREEELEKYESKGWDNFHEYGLDFSYVEPNTFKEQTRGYWRFQLSWGGPSDEIRFYVREQDNGPTELEKAEYWYMDWFDGASEDVTQSLVINSLWGRSNWVASQYERLNRG
tara:strand:+ start:148 stop:537 length:390 start_codon:yes stop_codon:yes gene_type:complete